MIELTTGNLLEADVEALVNTVNCVGFMGRGIAAQFKRAFPNNFRTYETACHRKQVVPGTMLVCPTDQLTNPRFIVNFPTKRHWRGNSRMEDIDAGLKALVAEVRERRIRSIAVPPLGCGLGGLDWSDVRPRIENAFADLPDVRVLVFAPTAAAPTIAAAPAAAPRVTPGRAVLVGLVERYLAGLMDPVVSLLEVHKLMYFAQEAGEPLRLRYVQAPHGPYAENLRHVLAAVEGYLLSGYGDGGDAPDKPLELVPGAAEDARAFLMQHPETMQRFDRVATLVDGFETPFGVELLATVHWVMTRQGMSSDEQIIEAVHGWGQHKHAFTPRQIALTAKRLRDQGWAPSRTDAAVASN
jgi:O-acetyl-ADP-ribose deacetylase (regulator of RNase III)